ncbi:hypothetical protein O3301_14095 [Janthinobacterium sp. SUN211]|uniref:hypothetical protein n=1 Tax=Janthinobacterium sp. SUN211 TaxID=3014786 RepID=UPI002713721E|nr:hypothetical protein [Janthinobacterium sp. SUN211]MDO8049595.1 hypothetical protein [Janthinobacterium sp. SUN211]
MRNGYTFAALVKQDVLAGPPADVLFFSMLALTQHGVCVSACDSIDALRQHMTAPSYYVAHNLVTHVGRRAIFKGSLVQASTANLLVFLDAALTCDDLRPMLIAPVFAGSPTQVIHIDDDVRHVYA